MSKLSSAQNQIKEIDTLHLIDSSGKSYEVIADFKKGIAKYSFQGKDLILEFNRTATKVSAVSNGKQVFSAKNISSKGLNYVDETGERIKVKKQGKSSESSFVLSQSTQLEIRNNQFFLISNERLESKDIMLSFIIIYKYHYLIYRNSINENSGGSEIILIV